MSHLWSAGETRGTPLLSCSTPHDPTQSPAVCSAPARPSSSSTASWAGALNPGSFTSRTVCRFDLPILTRLQGFAKVGSIYLSIHPSLYLHHLNPVPPRVAASVPKQQRGVSGVAGRHVVVAAQLLQCRGQSAQRGPGPDGTATQSDLLLPP